MKNQLQAALLVAATCVLASQQTQAGGLPIGQPTTPTYSMTKYYECLGKLVWAHAVLGDFDGSNTSKTLDNIMYACKNGHF